MNLNTALKAVQGTLKVGGKLIVKHLPTILTAVGSVGVVAGVILTAKKAPDAHKEFVDVKAKKDEMDKADYVWQCVKVGARYYGIVALVVGGSVVCFWSANHINLTRLGAALVLAKGSSDYAKDLEDQIKKNGGDKALTNMKDEINAEKIRSEPLPDNFDYAKLNHVIGETPVWEPVSRGWYVTTIHKILHAQEMVRADLAEQLKLGAVYAFVPMRDFLAYAGMEPSGPYSPEDSTNYLGFAVDVSNEANDLSISEIAERCEEACHVEWTSEIKDNSIGALALKYHEPPKYKFDWEGF